MKFFNEAKRVLKKDGFIVLFGRGTSFYRWNTRLADSGFTFKEEIVWDKRYSTSPRMAISRIHEAISIFTKGNGTINRVKAPYLEMKKYDIESIITDINQIKSALKNTKSLDAVLTFLETNCIDRSEICKANGITVSSSITKENRCVPVIRSFNQRMNEKSIVHMVSVRAQENHIAFGQVKSGCKVK
jgi:site-specific DNA-methyltransferase (adenine-specific)